ncbi:MULTISPECIES: bifunctional 2-polyprenyl-6-hydroxyphenol methylase/3-demethylubiquinol 3-O-methyltransferase UbiG [unclassified Duganella]|uniref:class I SAM-dependent methyltransferase n=1 Tax=unclassified Duganella TaxID=2636909 RepID=UPI000E34AE70|nr:MULTISPECIES: class I SAM-dependent methyltransferase [unclassified Duganella]RFP11916.1 class I SAM-dependent methyltransferase [Duganella sp. BJB475]RFP30074.1 class I SAM-dependent methyltransferase [Duganella sp. BJB476]
MNCIVCQQTTSPGLSPWHRICPACRYESAALLPTINDADVHVHVDEAQREAGLKAIRQQNFETIVGYAVELAPPGARRLLDVGAAHGWFLEAARGHFDVLGMEPDTAVAHKTAARGLPVRNGFFPDALEADERFDVIVFNDVIEHIPDIRSALAACRERLTPGGILILNLPNSRGFFYRLSKLFARVGWRTPFERLWQKDLPSPHVHYFEAGNLSKLVGGAGLELRLKAELPAVRAKNMLERLRCAGQGSWLGIYAQYAAVMLTIPVLRAFPSDIVVCVYRKA